MTDLRYPIGPFDLRAEVSHDDVRRALADIAAAPGRLRAAVAGLDDDRLDTPYREGGWTVRQLCHHVLDSHVNGYVRMRFALTEDEPTIQLYDQDAWARLPDARSAPVELSLDLLDGLVRRWTALLETTGPEDWRRSVRHPKAGRLTLGQLIALYGWHGRHHVAHVTALRERRGW